MSLVAVFGLDSDSLSVDGAAVGFVFVFTDTSDPLEAPVFDVIDFSDVVRAIAGLLFASLADAAVLVSTDLFA